MLISSFEKGYTRTLSATGLGRKRADAWDKGGLSTFYSTDDL
jgi:hypothetical protein